jgi:cyclopropane fatty-acyl-phospholipid synthase-like methyltransferase
MAENVKFHYNEITDGWRFIFGENFHLGYFRTPDETLDQATINLIDLLAGKGPISTSARVLDVGCGIGGPAFYLHEKYQCDITGITISERGAELAQKSNLEKGCSQKVRFEVADILGDFFPKERFDIIWIMEVAHLIQDKPKLFERCRKLLKDGGTLLLCDMITEREFSAFDILRHGKAIATMERTFGKAKTETLAYYRQALEHAGFCNIETLDVSQNIYPTMQQWRQNIHRYSAQLSTCMSDERIQDFLKACDILETFYREKMLGYGVINGMKRESRPS